MKEQLSDPNENVNGEKFTNTSLMELHSPRKRDSGGIHLTGRRAFTKKRRKLLEINQCNEQAIMNVLPYPINIEIDKTKK